MTESDVKQATGPAEDDVAQDKRPSRAWYGLAFFVMLIGLSAYTASLNVGRMKVAEMAANLQPVVAPGEAEMQLDEPGEYLVFYEQVGTLNGEPFDQRERFRVLPKMNLEIVEVATGDVVESNKVTSHTVYRPAGRSGYSEWEFEVERPGAYRVSADLDGVDIQDERFVLQVGQMSASDMTSDWGGVFGGAALFAFAFVISAVTVLVTYMLRHGAVTRLEE